MKNNTKRKKVLFITNLPAPYRIEFFNQFGAYVDLTVIFTEKIQDQKNRNKAWFSENYYNFTHVFLEPSIRMKGFNLCFGIKEYLKRDWDYIISGGYADPTQMYAFEWMKAHRIPFYLEMDGGMIKKDNILKYAIKKHYISMPKAWFSSGKATDDYLLYYGAKKEKIFFYPFTSMTDSDIKNARTMSREEKKRVRKELGINEDYIFLAVGQFIHRKGFDILIRACESLGDNIGVYIVGGEANEELISLRDDLGLANVHFVPFKSKCEIAKYYCMSDVFVMPTREDIWGLVINEAIAYGLPIISSDKCLAALQLVNNGENGIIVPSEDIDSLSKAMKDIHSLNTKAIDNISSSINRNYSIERMVLYHLNALQISHIRNEKELLGD